jgi:predicted nucleic acid-binding protein
MILLDTNVVAELMRPVPDARVLAWTKAQAIDELATSVVTVAEIGAGLACLPAGARRRDLVARWSRLQDDGFGERIFALDHAAAKVYGELFAQRQLAGRSTAAFDLLIASIAHIHGLTLATRNVRDFEDCGVQIVNPWTAAAPS